MSDRLNTAIAEAWSRQGTGQQLSESNTELDVSRRNDAVNARLLPVPHETDWSEVAEARMHPKAFERARVLTADSRSHLSGTIDILALRLKRMCVENYWSQIAVTTPTAGCGGTTVALNVAFALAESGSKVMVFDMAARKGGPLDALGISDPDVGATSDEGGTPFVCRIGSSVLIAKSNARSDRSNAQARTQACLADLEYVASKYVPEIVLLDLPPVLEDSQSLRVLQRVDAAMLVACASRSKADEIEQGAQRISETTAYLGAILNRIEGAGLET
ncbi:MAG: hypothetical protein AAFN27_12060 [Pseudomonadota bacterium]